jgi:transposase InsO family protein
MRYSQSEKMEIIRIVEGSELPVKRTLEELDVNRSTFYKWYQKYKKKGYEGLKNQSSTPKMLWNKIPEQIREYVVEMAIKLPEKSPRELAWYITDNEGYYISESSVYRILKSYDLITSPAYIVLSASDKFRRPTRRINELWQTDFTYFKIIGWGWYYLSTVLDDYSRYILAWKLSSTMSVKDVKETLDMAIEKTGINKIQVIHRPRLLSDNGPSYISDELKKYLSRLDIQHVRGAPFHPMTQGKIERYHRTLKNIIKLQNYFFPWQLKNEIQQFVDHYNNDRYHESLNNLKPVDVYLGNDREIMSQREILKNKTIKLRRRENLKLVS